MEDKECSARYYIDMLFYRWRVNRKNRDGTEEVLSYHHNLNDAKREIMRHRKTFCGYNSKYKIDKKDLYA